MSQDYDEDPPFITHLRSRVEEKISAWTFSISSNLTVDEYNARLKATLPGFIREALAERPDKDAGISSEQEENVDRPSDAQEALQEEATEERKLIRESLNRKNELNKSIIAKKALLRAIYKPSASSTEAANNGIEEFPVLKAAGGKEFLNTINKVGKKYIYFVLCNFP